MDLGLLALSTMIFPDPGVQRIFIHAEVTRGLRNGLFRLDRQFYCTLLKFRGIFFRRGLAHRTHLVGCVRSVSPCVRKSIATSARYCYRYYLTPTRVANGELAEPSLAELARVIKAGTCIEASLKRGKSEAGIDEYQVRTVRRESTV